jgi:hypothetical protein
MTKRDFERLAQAARAIRRGMDIAGHCNEMLFDDIVDQIALACQDRAGQGGFSYDKFRDACYRQ